MEEFVGTKHMKVKLGDVCEKGSSNIKQSDITGKMGEYPIYGASGYLGNVDFYQQESAYVAVVKDGAGIGRTYLHPAKSSVIGTMQYLLPKENVLPEYLCYVVKYMHLEKYFSGATIPHIYFKDYKNEEFNLDSLERQEEIINELKRVEDIPWIKIGDATDGDSIYLTSTKEYIIQEGVKKSRLVKAVSLIFANCGVSLGFARIINFDGCIHDGWLAMEDIDGRFDKVFLLQALNQMTEYFRRN